MRLLVICKHRFRYLFQQKLKWLTYFLLPVLSVIIAGAFINQTYHHVKVPIAIVDNSQSDYSQFVKQALGESKALTMIKEQDAVDAIQLLEKNKVDSVFVIPADFEDRVIRLELDDLITVHRTPMSLSAGIVQEVIASAITRLSTNVMAANKVESAYRELGILTDSPIWDEAWSYTDNQWKPEPLMTINYREQTVAQVEEVSVEDIQTEKERSSYFFVSLALYMLVILMAVEWLVDDRNYQRVQRLKSYRISVWSYLIGNTLPYFITFILSLLTLVIVLKNSFIMVDIAHGLSLYILFFIACLSLSVLVGVLTSTRSQLYVTTLAIVLLSTSLEAGNEWLAQQEVLQYFSWLSPIYWGMKGIHDIENLFPVSSMIGLAVLSVLFLLMAWKGLENNDD